MADDDLFLILEGGRPTVAPVAERAYDLMAPLARHDETHDWVMLRLLSGLTRGMDPIWSLVEHPGMVEHLQVDVAPVEWLPWLAAIVGGRLTAGMDDAQRRLEVKHPSGYERGKPGTIRAMVAGMLTGDRLVIFRPRDGRAAVLTIRTRLSETPDPEAVRAALRRNIPTGIVWTCAAVDERDWQEVADTWPTWADLEDLTWNDVNVP